FRLLELGVALLRTSLFTLSIVGPSGMVSIVTGGCRPLVPCEMDVARLRGPAEICDITVGQQVVSPHQPDFFQDRVVLDPSLLPFQWR
ncbi:hypothetical protein F5880DRAFT_1601728, partial [Lentinula raphanica]